MAEIGLQLKIERERRRLPRADVSRAIGVYIHHIAALEHADWDRLPEDAVVAGFVRSYAEYLGFDPEEAAADFARQRGIDLPPPPEPAVEEVGAAAAVQRAQPAPVEQSEQPAQPAPSEPVAAPADGAVDTPSAEPLPPEESREEVASRLPIAAEEPLPEEPPSEEPLPEEPRPAEAAPAPAPEPIAGARDKRFPLLPVLAAGALILVIALWLGFRGSGESDAVDVDAPDATSIDAPAPPGPPPATATRSEPEPESEPTIDPATTSPSASGPAAGRSAEAQPDDQPSAPPPAAGAAALTVTEYGVGTGVRDHQLVGESDRFRAGTKVWFWTRVRGGSPGSTLRHVWLHEGRVIDATTLRIGSSNWRTQSAKTLYSEGSWAVEARDGAGRVLARSELTSTR